MATSPRPTGPRRVKRPVKRITTTAPHAVADEEVIIRSQESQPRTYFWSRSIRESDITNFLRQLIMLLEAGTPILRALRTLSQRGSSRRTRALVADITQYVEAGNPLWQAFDRHPRYFDAVFVNLIRASEASGTLVTVLRRAVSFRERRELLRKRVRGAMVYPLLLVVASLAVFMLLIYFVVPQFQEIFDRADLTPPWYTQAFFDFSEFLAVWWWVPVLVIIVLVLIYKLWYVRHPIRRIRADKMKLKVPITGPIAQKNAIVELTRVLALLLKSGLSMMASLELTRNAIHNRAVAHVLQDVRNSVEQGRGLEEPLRENEDVIPPVVTDMLVTGEEAGRVDIVCEQIADQYEEEVRISLATLGETLQPIFTLIIAVVVIALFIALFLPLISMIEQLSQAGV